MLVPRLATGSVSWPNYVTVNKTVDFVNSAKADDFVGKVRDELEEGVDLDAYGVDRTQ